MLRVEKHDVTLRGIHFKLTRTFTLNVIARHSSLNPVKQWPQCGSHLAMADYGSITRNLSSAII